jgi:hypothetical protein
MSALPAPVPDDSSPGPLPWPTPDLRPAIVDATPGAAYEVTFVGPDDHRVMDSRTVTVIAGEPDPHRVWLHIVDGPSLRLDTIIGFRRLSAAAKERYELAMLGAGVATADLREAVLADIRVALAAPFASVERIDFKLDGSGAPAQIVVHGTGHDGRPKTVKTKSLRRTQSFHGSVAASIAELPRSLWIEGCRPGASYELTMLSGLVLAVR